MHCAPFELKLLQFGFDIRLKALALPASLFYLDEKSHVTLNHIKSELIYILVNNLKSRFDCSDADISPHVKN